MRFFIAVLLLGVLGLCAVESQQRKAPKKATEYEGANVLDFWVGKWDVKDYKTAQKYGTDIVEKVVDGAGIVEHWKDASGEEGKSLFYFMPAEKRWKQVWVTPYGIYKEKLSEAFPNGIRFVGKVFLPDGKTVDDRTTLTKEPGGKVRQVIENSQDGGKTWKVGFDATYEKMK